MRVRNAAGAVVVLVIAAVVGAGLPSGAAEQDLSNVQATSPVDEGSATTLTGTIDTTCATANLQVNWGDGSRPESFTDDGSGDFSHDHTYADDNPTATPSDQYTINVALSTACGESDTAQTTVTVDNVDPVIDTLNVFARGPRQSTSIAASFGDAGAQDTHRVTIDWGDGTEPDSLDLPPGANGFHADHEYEQDGTYQVDVTLTDDDTGATGASAVADVIGHQIVTGPGARLLPAIQKIRSSGRVTERFLAFRSSFTGGVRVAVGDVNADGRPDIIAGAGPGGGPHVKVFSGQDGSVLHSFFAFRSSFAGGVFVAAGDVNGDKRADIIVAPGAGGGPHVRVFSGLDGSLLDSFFAYRTSFTGGVRVAAADFDGDGLAEIITGAGPGGGPHVKVRRGDLLLNSFFAFRASYRGGVYVAGGDVNGDGFADIIVGADAGGGPHVRVFSAGEKILRDFFAFRSSFRGGVRVAVGDMDSDGKADLIVGAGAGGGPHVKVFSGRPDLAVLSNFFAYPPSFTGGVYVAFAALPASPDG